MFGKQISSQIKIAASASEVWKVLTNFEDYSSWNPFIIRAKGMAIEGSKLEGDFKPVGAKPTTIRPHVTRVIIGQELRWVGRIGSGGLFDAEHIFKLEPLPHGQVLLTQQEKFSGILVPFFNFEGSLAAFSQMNEALKIRVEAASLALLG